MNLLLWAAALVLGGGIALTLLVKAMRFGTAGPKAEALRSENRLVGFMTVALAIAILFLSTSKNDSEPKKPSLATGDPSPSYQASAPQPSKRQVTRKEFGDAWPFTVDSGEVDCVRGMALFKANGVTYGINGTAKSHGYPGAEPIWRRNPKPGMSTTRVNIGPIIERARALCR